MNLESNIKDTISKKLEEGIVEKLVEEQLEKGIVNALSSLFGSYGDVTKVIEEKVKAVMIPHLERYDYSKYLVKLDSVLVEVLKSSSLDNTKLLSNFKELMTNQEIKKTIKVSELFDKWTDFVAKDVETDGLDIDYDDGVSYKAVDVTLEIEYDNDRNWSSFQYATMVFECEHDEAMNFAIRLSRWNKNEEKIWDMHYDTKHEIEALRYLNEFEVFLMKLNQDGTKIEIDTDYEEDQVTPEKEPEASFE
jgi:hypothetical protein